MIFIVINDDVIKFGRKKATEDEMNAALELKSDEVPQSMPKGFKIWTLDILVGHLGGTDSTGGRLQGHLQDLQGCSQERAIHPS